MEQQKYRLNSATLAITSVDERIPIMIPAGSTVVTDGPLDGAPMVDVVWEGKAVRMFAVDLRERGTRMDAR